MCTLKFYFNVAPPGGYPENNHRNERPSGHNWNSGCMENHNSVYNQGRGDDRRNNGGNRGSYNIKPSNRSSSTTWRRVGFNRSDRFPESAGSCGHNSYQDYQEFKRWNYNHDSSSHRSRNEEHNNEENDHKRRHLMSRG